MSLCPPPSRPLRLPPACCSAPRCSPQRRGLHARRRPRRRLRPHRTAARSRSYPHRGRQFVVGRPGNEYAIRIRNCSDRRVLAVVSVDGVNVVTGETAAPDQSGYVIEPYGYVTIEGWRKDLERTAAFYFTDPGDAYATRTGRPDDLGVIGVALFREREPAWSQRPVAVASAPGAARRSRRDAKAASRPGRPTRLRRRRSAPATGAASGRRRSGSSSSARAAAPTSVSRSATTGCENLVAHGRAAATHAAVARARPVPGRARLRARPVSGRDACDRHCRVRRPRRYCRRRMWPADTSTAEESDEALMLAYGRGDAAAFERLYAAPQGTDVPLLPAAHVRSRRGGRTAAGRVAARRPRPRALCCRCALHDVAVHAGAPSAGGPLACPARRHVRVARRRRATTPADRSA